MTTKKNAKSDILQLWVRLPPFINYMGYRFDFRLKYEGTQLYVGYFVAACFSKSKVKKEAFSMGIWHEEYRKREHKRMSSVHSSYLFKCLVFCCNDEDLYWSMSAIYDRLLDYKLVEQPIDNTAQIIDYQDITNVGKYLTHGNY